MWFWTSSRYKCFFFYLEGVPANLNIFWQLNLTNKRSNLIWNRFSATNCHPYQSILLCIPNDLLNQFQSQWWRIRCLEYVRCWFQASHIFFSASLTISYKRKTNMFIYWSILYWMKKKNDEKIMSHSFNQL